MKIITGYKAEPHITSQQDRNVNMGIFGTGAYIANLGNKLAATVVSANEITIADGLLVAEGCTAEVERGTSESMAIENGSQGMLRIDLIVARYTKAAGTGVEDMQLAVITGTPAASNPATPSYNTGSIANGDTLVDFPLYTVNLNGISIESVTRNVSYIELATSSALESARTALQNSINSVNTTLTNLINTTKTQLQNSINSVSSTLSTVSGRVGTAALNTTKTQLQNSINSVSSTLSTVSGRVGTATLNTTAKNALAAINELLTKINTANTNISSNTTKINTANSNITAVANRATALENKTAGIVKSISYDVAASSNNYKQLNASSMYLLILNGGTTSNTVRGIYQIGVTGGKALGIKAISSATIAEVTDGGSGLRKIHNTGSVVLRATLITTYGS